MTAWSDIQNTDNEHDADAVWRMQIACEPSEGQLGYDPLPGVPARTWPENGFMLAAM